MKSAQKNKGGFRSEASPYLLFSFGGIDCVDLYQCLPAFVREPLHIRTRMRPGAPKLTRSQSCTCLRDARGEILSPYSMTVIHRFLSGRRQKPFSSTFVSAVRLYRLQSYFHSLLAALRLRAASAPAHRQAAFCVDFHIGIAPAYPASAPRFRFGASPEARECINVTQNAPHASHRHGTGQLPLYPLVLTHPFWI